MTPEQIAALTPDQLASLPSLEELGTLRKRADDFTAAESRWGEERTMLGAGLADAEGQDLARYLYGRTPAEGRPAFGDWLGKDGKAHKALAPWFGQPAAKVESQPDAAKVQANANAAHVAPPPGATPAPVPPKPTGAVVGPGAPAGQKLDAAFVDAIVSRCLKSGDWTEYEKVRPQILGRASGSIA